MLRTAREECGLTTYDLAAVQCCPRTRVHEWEDPDGHRAHTPLDLALDPTIGPTLLRLIAEHHGLEVSKTPERIDEIASDVLALATAAQQSSECVAAYAAAIADGTITAAERDQVEREATEAIAALTSLRARVRSVPSTGASVRVLRAVEGS